MKKERPQNLTPKEAEVALREANSILKDMQSVSEALTRMVDSEQRLTLLGLGDQPHSDFVSAVSKMRAGEGNPRGPMPPTGTLHHFKMGLHELMSRAMKVVEETKAIEETQTQTQDNR